MKSVILALTFIFISGFVFSQNTRVEITQLGVFSNEDDGQAKVYFSQDSRLKDIMIGKAQSKKELSVWRVQIYLGSGKNSRAEAESTRNSFKTKYPEIDAEVLYNSPYFKVHVGSFKTRLEAESLKLKIQGEYSKSWVVNEVLGEDN
jgi:hypothetical protein